MALEDVRKKAVSSLQLVFMAPVTQSEMGLLSLAQCKGLRGACSHKAGLQLPGACFLMKEAGRTLVKLGTSLAQRTYLHSAYSFASLGFMASVPGLEQLRDLSSEPGDHLKTPLWPLRNSETWRNRFPFS